jgi:ketopantoate hydroxymethyltransferase
MIKDKIRITDVARMKSKRKPIAMLTAYDYARIFDEAGVDVLLVAGCLVMVMKRIL